MAYTYTFASESDMRTWLSNGDFKRLFDSSLPYIDTGNYEFADDATYDQKYDRFMGVFLANASNNCLDEYDDHYVVASYENNKLLALYQGFYNPSDTSFNLCTTLYDDDANGSRSYSYKAL